MKEEEPSSPRDEGKGKESPEYVPPVIKTYTSDEIMEEIGPAHACSPAPCAIAP